MHIKTLDSISFSADVIYLFQDAIRTPHCTYWFSPLGHFQSMAVSQRPLVSRHLGSFQESRPGTLQNAFHFGFARCFLICSLEFLMS